MISSALLALSILAAGASAQNATATASGTPTYSTVTFNVSAAVTELPNNDYSNERLAQLWDQVGPIAVHENITATVEAAPKPKPTAHPQPGALHPLLPSAFDLDDVKLPEGFAWGLSSSAYQLEGAAKDEGKGPSIWDLLSHRVPNQVADNTTGDVLAQHYYLYKQDFARLHEFGAPHYSPSISWPRIFPFGHGPVNAEGVAHYDDVIDTLIANGITPAVSLFHWDTPLALFNEFGGWSSPKIVEHYVNYAKFIITRYDDKVPIWFTINEPQYCNWQYSWYPTGDYYPSYGFKKGVESRFLCGHHTLLAHAKVAKWYHEEFKGKGKITFKNSGNYFQPNSTSEADKKAVSRAYDFVLGWFGGPWTDGDYPQTLKDTLGDKLPKYTEEEKAIIKGSCDFYAIDAYTAYTVNAIEDEAACVGNSTASGFPECVNQAGTNPDGFGIGPSSGPTMEWLKSTPLGIRKFLGVITKELFPAVKEIMVTEFGFAEPFESQYATVQDATWDLRRVDYLQNYLDSILLAIHEDGINVTGAFVWSIFDNFEWNSGSDIRFGVQHLNYETLVRTPKASWYQLIDWFTKHGADFINGPPSNGTYNSPVKRSR